MSVASWFHDGLVHRSVLKWYFRCAVVVQR